MATSNDNHKFCIECGSVLLDHRTGAAASELFDSELLSKSGILRLRECSHCGVADRYVETDGTLVLIDLVLGTKAAYRHVLLNGGEAYARLILKMALLAVICDGYIGWKELKSGGEFFEQEFHFYGYCGRALAGLVTFVMIALPSLLVYGAPSRCPSPTSTRIWAGLLGLLMAYGSRFLKLSALFWAPETAELLSAGALMWVFIYLLFFVATVRALQVTQRRSLPSSLVLAFLSHAGFVATVNYDVIVNPFICGD